MSELYINIYKGGPGGESAESQVFTDIYKAAEDAEAYSSIYSWTAVCTKKTDLREYFSEEYHAEQRLAAEKDRKIRERMEDLYA